MKKLNFTFCMLIFASSLAFAQLYPPKRIFEAGADINFSASQNAVSVTDIFVENLVIDFTEIAEGFNGNGFILGADTDADAFFNFNIGKRWGFGLAADVNASMEFGIGQGLWDFLAYGNWNETTGAPSDTEFDLSLSLESFAELSAPIKFGLKNLGIKVTPTYYIPLAYVPYTSADIVIASGNSSNGKTLTASGTAAFDLYSIINLDGVFTVTDGTPSFNAETLSETFSDMLSNAGSAAIELLQSGGLSVGICADYPIFNSLTLGVYADVPISAGKLSYKASGTVTATADVDGLLDSVSESLSSSSDSTSDTSTSDTSSSDTSTSDTSTSEGTSSSSELYSIDYSVSDITYSELEEAYSVRKPLRLGAEAAWRPFGSWFTIRGMLGYAARNPFGEDWNWKKSMFMEYSAGVDVSLLYVLRIYASTSYIDKVFAQQLGLGINLRATELTVKIASSGTSLAQSFSLGGAKAAVGITVGF